MLRFLQNVENAEDERCHLAGGFFENMVQVTLGFIALSVLVYKRTREHPPRPIKVWAFDASKQAIGALCAHLANLVIAVFLSYLSSSHNSGQHNDQCAFYFVNFFVDTSVGVFLNWGFFRILTIEANKRKWISLMHPGEYGMPPSVRIWAVQLSAWLGVVILTKAILAAVMSLFIDPLGALSDWMFRPLQKYPHVELVIVMIACPCLMNAVQFWIQDNFLKKPEIPESTPVPAHEVEGLTQKQKSSDDTNELSKVVANAV